MKKLIIIFLALFCLIEVSAQTWNEVQKIVGSNRSAGDNFCDAVSISGNYAIIGVKGEDEDVAGANTINGAGAAYIFKRDGSGNWSEVQMLLASDRSGFTDWFGYSVAIDGDYAIVGAKNEDEDETGANTINGTGSAYIFERDGSGTWNEVQKIVASDRSTLDEFGFSVSISGDYAAVGTIKEAENATGTITKYGAGSVYIFKRDVGGTWNQHQKIVASDRNSNDNFGYSISISNNYLIVGARGEDHDASGLNYVVNSGSAYIFEKDGSDIWNQVKKIVPSDRGANYQFGHSISMDGDYAVVGANFEGVGATTRAGAAYIFERNGSGIWSQIQSIFASVRLSDDNFGQSVSNSGDYVIVGAMREGEDEDEINTLSGAGSAYIFKRDNGGAWNQMQKIVTSDRTGGDFFGTSISISNEYVIGGAPFEDHDATGLDIMSNAGSSYIFELDLELGIDENDFETNSFKIYPNPISTGFVNIASKYSEPIKATVFDILGKQVLSKEVINNKLDISNLNIGLYILKLTQNNAIVIKKLVVK